MNFEKLLNENKIEKISKSDFSAIAGEKSLEFAKKGLETNNYDEVMSVTYNGVFKVVNKFMNFFGYRAIGKEHHKNAFEFLKKININQDLVSYFDKIRQRRNNFIYRDVEGVSKKEAGEIIQTAEEFIKDIKKFIEKSKG